jgi:Tetracyclin repressor-like, C-terminal domain
VISPIPSLIQSILDPLREGAFHPKFKQIEVQTLMTALCSFRVSNLATVKAIAHLATAAFAHRRDVS